jgi:virulence factor
MMLSHPHIVGTLELSTAYAWTTAEESLKVCTSKGIYRLSQMDELTFESKPSTILGIPIEKCRPYHKTIEYLYARNGFTPTLPNNSVCSQGYFNEIQAFVSFIEHDHSCVLTDISTVRQTYETILRISKAFNPNPYKTFPLHQ